MEDFGVKEKNMERTRKRFGLLTLSMILAILVSMMLPALAAAQPDPTREPQPPVRLTIKSPNGTNTAVQGEEVEIIVEGFFEFEPVDIVITDPSGRVFQVARVTTNTAGERAIVINLRGVGVGTFNVVAVGLVSGFRATAPGSTTGTTSSQGRFLLIEGTNFFPTERVSCFATFPDGTVRQLFENEITTAGEFSETVFVGAMPVGTLAITCFGISSARSAITRVEVTQGDFLAPIVRGTAGIEVSPKVASRTNATFPRAEQVFVIRAEGFRPGERVSFFFTAPDGTVDPAATREVVADSAGEAAITRVFRSTALTGRWFVTAFGQTSLFRGITDFTVLP